MSEQSICISQMCTAVQLLIFCLSKTEQRNHLWFVPFFSPKYRMKYDFGGVPEKFEPGSTPHSCSSNWALNVSEELQPQYSKFNYPSVPSEHGINLELWRAEIWAPHKSHLMDERWNSVGDRDWSEGPGRSAVDSSVQKRISGPRSSLSRVRWTLASWEPKTHSFFFKQSLWWFTLKKSDISETTPHEFKADKLCNIFYLCLLSSKDSKLSRNLVLHPNINWCFVPNKITRLLFFSFFFDYSTSWQNNQ